MTHRQQIHIKLGICHCDGCKKAVHPPATMLVEMDTDGVGAVWYCSAACADKHGKSKVIK